VNFLHDLRRRRMFRLVGLYIVSAWIVIQVAEALFQAWGIPDTAMRYMFIAAVLCFPIALVFGWVYDITSQGIVRTKTAGTEETADLRLKRQDYLILTALLVIGVVILLGSAEKIYEEIDELPAVAGLVDRLENSIAVLPFTNLDINADTRFFSDGVTEEILHRLSTQGALHVLASTSSFALRDSEDGPARISEILGVRYLLRGSVRRDNDYVRITANLLDASGYTLWTQTFDRKLEGIFTIQSDIASKVSNEVLSEIVPLADLPAGRTTQNMDAYDEFLIGRAFFNSRPPGWQEPAAAAFRRAIELDDQFAPPYAGLAMSLYILQNDEYLAEARSAAEKSIELDPDLAEGHAILGLILSLSSDEISAGTRALQRALEIDPSFAVAHSWLASALYNQNLRAEGDAVMDRGLAIDPLNPTLSVNVANNEARNGDFERAEQLMLRLTYLPETPGVALFELTALYFEWGRLDQALHWAKEIVRAFAGTNNTVRFATVAWSFERLGMSDDADYWINVYLAQTPSDPGRFLFPSYLLRVRGDWEQQRLLIKEFEQSPEFIMTEQPGFIAAIYGTANLFARNYDKGIGIFESRFDISFSGIAEYMEDSDAYEITHFLAYAYAQVGQTETSLRLLTELAEVLDEEDSGPLQVPSMLEHRATVRASLGDHQGALEALREAADLGWTNYFWIANDPSWHATLAEPGFGEFLAEIRAEIELQRAIVEQANEQHDFRVEMELLLSR
jgi:adenylate cyclase